MKTLLTNALNALRLPLSNDQIDLLLAYGTRVLRYNETTNITAERDPERFLIRHTLDSLAGAPYFANARTLIDVGAGAGLPGIPLAIALPSLTVTLCESKRKKSEILTNIISDLGLSNVRVYAKNAHEVFERFDAVTARAFARTERILPLIKTLAFPKGNAYLYKGRKETIENELQKVNKSMYNIRVQKLYVPYLEEERHLLIVSKRET